MMVATPCEGGRDGGLFRASVAASHEMTPLALRAAHVDSIQYDHVDDGLSPSSFHVKHVLGCVAWDSGCARSPGPPTAISRTNPLIAAIVRLSSDAQDRVVTWCASCVPIPDSGSAVYQIERRGFT